MAGKVKDMMLVSRYSVLCKRWVIGGSSVVGNILLGRSIDVAHQDIRTNIIRPRPNKLMVASKPRIR